MLKVVQDSGYPWSWWGQGATRDFWEAGAVLFHVLGAEHMAIFVKTDQAQFSV